MPSLRPSTLRALFLALVAAGSCSGVARAQEPADGGPPTLEVLTRILTERDAAPHELFELLARRDDPAAQSALERAVGALHAPESLEAAYEAFALYRGRGELEAGAVEFLTGEARRQVASPRRAATRALARFGSRAHAELRALVEENEDPECRRIAIGGIVPALQVRRSWEDLELLIDWYTPPLSGSYEVGVRALAAFADEASLERFELALEERELAVSKKAMILAALARIGGERATELALEALRASQPGVQLAAIHALTELGCTQHARDLARLERERDPAVRHAAFLAQAPLRAGDPKWPDEVRKAARSRDWALRMAAARALAEIGTEPALEALRELAADAHPLVRRDAVRALATVRREDTVALLVARMPRESLRNQREVRDALRALTGLDLGANPTRWTRWWEDEGEGYRLPTPAELRDAARARAVTSELPATESSFYGIPIHSDRVAFVLDVSGSMSALSYSGGMRIDAVKRELYKVLESLPPDARFNLYFFDDRVHAWKRRLVEADERARSDAAEFVRRQGPGGGTALFDGLAAAYDDPDVDTIVLLSDGQPTAGELIEPRAILEQIEQWNVLREVTIHTVSVEWSGELLRELAAQTGGTFIEVR